MEEVGTALKQAPRAPLGVIVKSGRLPAPSAESAHPNLRDPDCCVMLVDRVMAVIAGEGDDSLLGGITETTSKGETRTQPSPRRELFTYRVNSTHRQTRPGRSVVYHKSHQDSAESAYVNAKDCPRIPM